MKSKISFLSLLLLLLFSTQISYSKTVAESLTRKAVSKNTAEASPALARLRTLGPSGLQALMDQYQDEIRYRVANPSAAPDEQWQRIATALDTVAQQKNSYLAGLYWHTDLEEAKKAAAAANKPILSLRLLGKLTDEFSCANSRFFRTVLYPNEEVSQYLRENYVLHWQSVRPVPKVTIDYGDGRKLERTLTGNSIHYILDSQAYALEAIPGLYGPQAFRRALVDSQTLFKSLAGKTAHERNGILFQYYGDRLKKIALDWARDTTKIGNRLPLGLQIQETANGEALRVASLAATKLAIESSILLSMSRATQELGRITDEAAWKRIAELHSSDAVLDGRSTSLIKRQNPTASEIEMARLLRKFQELIALDTVRNEYLMHSELYKWLMKDAGRNNVEKLNEKVYASLFRTPNSDPWLGLFSADLYTALDNGGVVKP